LCIATAHENRAPLRQSSRSVHCLWKTTPDDFTLID